jgi:long-chain acyl-CoA synthetase
MNLKQILEQTAKRYGDKTAIIYGEERLSYAELDESSNKIANALIERGVEKGDRVAIVLPDIPQFPVIFFGVVKAGGIAVRQNPKASVKELASFFDDCEPKVLVADSSVAEALHPILPKLKYIKHVIDLSSYRQILATASAQRVEMEPEPGDIVDIAYTSGTTGRPKGIVLSHQALMTSVTVAAGGLEQSDKDIVMHFALPFYHMFALLLVVLASVYRGSTVVMVPGLSIGDLFKAVEKEKGTMFHGVPSIYSLAINMAEGGEIKNDLTSLRLCLSAGAPLPVESAKKFKKYYGLDLVQVYGTTEAPTTYSMSPLDGTDKLGSVGKLRPEVEVKIVDENNKQLPPNQPGEIALKGSVMNGYYNSPEATAEVLKDGWFYTGDIGKVDDDNYLFIMGRKKDMIIVGGHNVYPVDVEDVLYQHPKVNEAAVVGVPDKVRGEAIRAVVSLKEGEVATEKEIKQFCREHLTGYKVPREVIFVDSLPKTATGKIDKKPLKDSQ